MAGLAEAVVAAKDGIATFLSATSGLRTADQVTVRSGVLAPEDFTGDLVVLGDATLPATGPPGLAGRQATVTVQGWVIVTRPGSDETAVRAVRARAAALMGLVEASLDADPTAAGTVQPPGGLTAAPTGLEESSVDDNGTAARRATIPFQLGWTSHV
jgi:hypothetical protein